MALFLAGTLTRLGIGIYVFVCCWFHLYDASFLALVGAAVPFIVILAAFRILGRAFPDEIVDYRAGLIEFPFATPSQIHLADLKEIHLLPEERTRKGNTKQPIEFVLHNGQVIKGYGSYKFFRDISDYVEVYDEDGTPFYPKEVYFYGILALWGLSALIAAAGVISLYWRP